MATIEKKIYQLKDAELTIESIQVEDAEEVIEVIKQLDTETDFLLREPGEFQLGLEEEKNFISTVLNTQKNLLIKATLNGKIVGSLGFTVAPQQRYHHKGQFGFAIMKEHWGKGIGKALMETLIQWCTEKKIEKLTLEVDTTNTRAIELYKSYGFQQEGYLKKDKKMKDGTYRDTFLMAKFIE